MLGRKIIAGDVRNALGVLHSGGVVCYLTDTLIALACLPNNKTAIDKIYSIKKRKIAKPLAFLVKSYEITKELINNLDYVLDKSPYLGDFQQGRVTFLLPSSASWLGQKYLLQKYDKSLQKWGVRIPNDLSSRKILRHALIICATSANYSGAKPLLSIEMAMRYFSANVDYYCYNNRRLSLRVRGSKIIDSTLNPARVIRE